MDTIEFRGIEVEFTYYPGERATREYPGAQPWIEIESARVSDWDEFAAWWGVKEGAHMFEPSLEMMIERILDKFGDAIEQEASDHISSQEPDFDPPDEYDFDDYGW